MLSRPQSADDRGSALLYVLWVSILLAVLLAGATGLAQRQARLAGAQGVLARTDADLRSALELVAYDIALTGRTGLSDLPRVMTLPDGVVEVSLASTHARMDINMASVDDWEALLIRAGRTPADARRLAERILDWRDNDEQARPQGMEAADYPESWRRRPANRGFVSVEELRAVSGVSDSLWGCIAPVLTVFGGTPDGDDVLDVTGQDNELTGVRVSLRAQRRTETGLAQAMTGTVLYGFDGRAAYEWVSFGEEGLSGLGCGA